MNAPSDPITRCVRHCAQSRDWRGRWRIERRYKRRASRIRLDADDCGDDRARSGSARGVDSRAGRGDCEGGGSVSAIPNSSPWGDKQVARFNYRVGLFTRRGMSAPDAETLADRLAERDFESDDRRTCVECEHLQRSRTCSLNQPITVDHMQLIRCPVFAWQKP